MKIRSGSAYWAGLTASVAAGVAAVFAWAYGLSRIWWAVTGLIAFATVAVLCFDVVQIVERFYYGSDAARLAAQAQEHDRRAGERHKAIETQLARIASDYRAELEEKYPIGHVILYANGRSRIFYDKHRGKLDLDWQTAEIREFNEQSVVVVAPNLTTKPGTGSADTTIAGLTITLSRGRSAMLYNDEEMQVVLELLEIGGDEVAVVFGARPAR